MLRSLSPKQLATIKPEADWSIGRLASLAALLEATAIKAGNVHPQADFEDINYADFCRSAEVLEVTLDQCQTKSCGAIIFETIKKTKEVVGSNTNLGIVLLLIPIAKAYLSQDTRTHQLLSESLRVILDKLDAQDAADIYRAIRLAQPGSLGRSDEMDVKDQPPSEILQAMRLAASWDDIAKAYATNFCDIFEMSSRLSAIRQHMDNDWLRAIPRIQVERLAAFGDTLIRRKSGAEVDGQVKRLAKICLDKSTQGIEIESSSWKQLDDYLRQDGNRRNPGTTADLIAAAVLIELLRMRGNGL